MILVPINGFEGLYSISACGKIWSHYKRLFLRPGLRKDGYEIVILYRNGVPFNGVVHRLVAKTWLPSAPCEAATQVNHIDGVKRNNRVENLEWVSAKDNVRHAIRTGLFTPDRDNARRMGMAARKLTVAEAMAIKESIAVGVPQVQLARAYGVSTSTVQYIKKGLRYAADN